MIGPGNLKNVQIILTNDTPVYILLGQEAADAYTEIESIDKLIDWFKRRDEVPDAYIIENGPFWEILEAFDGYFGYVEISKIDYEQLLKYYNDVCNI